LASEQESNPNQELLWSEVARVVKHEHNELPKTPTTTSMDEMRMKNNMANAGDRNIKICLWRREIRKAFELHAENDKQRWFRWMLICEDRFSSLATISSDERSLICFELMTLTSIVLKIPCTDTGGKQSCD